MKSCPRCKAITFDDMEVCYSCMYRFPSFPSDDELFRSMEDLLIRNWDENEQTQRREDASAESRGEGKCIARLEFCEYGGQRREYTVREGSSLLIGRSNDCWIVLKDARVSRKHARIDCDAKGIWIEDLGSLNATYLNGCSLKERVMLKVGDEFTICGFKFIVHYLP